MNPKPTVFRVSFFCVALALPSAALLHVAQLRHASLVLSHYFGGRAGNCTLAESFEGEALSRLQFESVTEIRAASKVIRKDEQFSLWSTPAGEYWVPTASGHAVIDDLNLVSKNETSTEPEFVQAMSS